MYTCNYDMLQVLSFVILILATTYEKKRGIPHNCRIIYFLDILGVLKLDELKIIVRIVHGWDP